MTSISPASPPSEAFAPNVRIRDLVVHLFAWVVAVVVTSALVSPTAFSGIDALAPGRFGFLRVARRVATLVAIVLLWTWLRRDGVRSFRALGATREGWRSGLAWRAAAVGVLAMGGLMVLELALGERHFELETHALGPWIRGLQVIGGAVAVALLEELTFRGALLFPFGRMRGGALFLQTTLISALYATIHFARGSSGKGMTVGWASGLDTWSGLVSTAVLEREAWVGLFAFGCWLNLLARRHGHVWGVVGLHAGIVVALQLAGDLTEPTRPVATLFFTSGLLPGWATTALLAVAIAVLLHRDSRDTVTDSSARIPRRVPG